MTRIKEEYITEMVKVITKDGTTSLKFYTINTGRYKYVLTATYNPTNLLSYDIEKYDSNGKSLGHVLGTATTYGVTYQNPKGLSIPDSVAKAILAYHKEIAYKVG